MKTIYKTKESRKTTLELYDTQLSKLNCDYKDIYLNTFFGETHLIEMTPKIIEKTYISFFEDKDR